MRASSAKIPKSTSSPPRMKIGKRNQTLKATTTAPRIVAWPGSGGEHEAGVVRRRRHDDSIEQAPTVIQRAEGASLERRGEHDASALLDVVRADGDLCGREQPSVERVDAEGAVVTARHVGTAGEERDVLR